MPRRQKVIGKGAVVSCLARMLHPSKAIRDRFINMNPKKRLTNLIVIDQKVEKINKKELECIVVQSDEVMEGDVHVRLYASKKYFKVTIEGNRDDFFITEGDNGYESGIEEAVVEETVEHPQALLERIQQEFFDEDDINALRVLVEVDSDNDPAPENIPTAVVPPNECQYEEWGHDNICERKKLSTFDKKARLNFPNSFQPSLVDLFELLFPVSYIKDVMLPLINAQTELGEVFYGEFLRWLGLWFLMATIQGPSRIDFWRKDPISIFEGAPFRLGDYMSRNRFDDILKGLEFMSEDPPPYKDKFFRIRDIVKSWNENMFENFTPGWISCLDESMMVWTNQFTCPGFMFVPRKPHPFGNEWHSICCGLSGVMFAIELVEGKDRPPEAPKLPFENEGKTVGLLLRMTEKLWGSARVVVLDSGFCVLKGLIELRKKGVFAAAIVKKRRYWPKYIDGEGIKQHFEGMEVGAVDAIRGTLDGTTFHVMGMKEAPYVMTVMTTYGTINRTGKETERFVGPPADRRRIKFNYPEVFGNHFKYRHMVDDHNARRHAPISFEESWATKTWTHRIFAFLIAITEVNMQLCSKYFYVKDDVSQINYRKELCKSLIFNKYVVQEAEEGIRRSRKRPNNLDHELITLPPFKKFHNLRIVASNMQYAQFKCTACPKRTRKYCRCTPGIFRCQECYATHKSNDDILFSSPGQTSVSRTPRRSASRK